MPKGDIFPEKKRMEANFVYVLEYMLSLISTYKMQNISTLMRKSSKSDGRAFQKLLTSETGSSPPVKYFC